MLPQLRVETPLFQIFPSYPLSLLSMFSSFFTRSTLSKTMVALMLTTLLSPAALAASGTLMVEAGDDQTIELGELLVIDNEASVTGFSGLSTDVTGTIDWGDNGEGEVDVATFVLDGSTLYFQGSHDYSAIGNGQYNVRFCADDIGDGVMVCDQFMITVAQPDLTASNLTLEEISPGLYQYSVDYANEGLWSVDAATAGGVNTASINGAVHTGYSWNIIAAENTLFLEAGGETLGASAFTGGIAFAEGDFIEVCVDGTEMVVESDETNNCVSTTFSLSDLIVDSVTVDSSDYSLDIAFTNTGAGDVPASATPAFDLIIEVPGDSGLPTPESYELMDYVTEDADFRVAGETMIVSIEDAEGAVADFCASEPSLEDRTWSFSVLVDSESEVTETEEGNNTYETSFDICAVGDEAAADLDITDIIVDESTGALSYVAANLGDLDVDYTADAYGDTDIYIDADFDDSDVEVDYSYLWVDEVNAGNWTGEFFLAGGTETIDSGVILTPGEHTVTVCIYPAVYFGETAYGFENCETETFTVGEALLPDLVIESVIYNADQTLHFMVSNQGTAALTSEQAVYLSLYDQTSGSGVAVEEFLLSDYGVDYMSIGGSVEFNSTYTLPVLPTTILAVVDPMGDITELTESVFEANYYRATFGETGSGSDGSSSGSVPAPAGSGSGSSNGGSSNNNDNDEEDEDVVLTEEELDSCADLAFTDVSEDDEAYEAIYAMWCAGVIHGKDATHFAPADYIKRDEVTKIVGRFFGYVTTAHEDIPEVTETSYEDVSVDEPLAYYVETLTEEGYFVEEALNEEFRPHEDMTYGEIVDLLNEIGEEEVSMEGYEEDDSVSRGNFMDMLYTFFQ